MTTTYDDSWRALPARQQPEWPDAEALRATTDTLRRLPPLVFAGECRTLRARLAAVARGEAFLLQGGDCAETFAALSADGIRDKIKTLLQMAIVLTYGAAVPVVKVGRMAGQLAKPRSSDVEVVDGVSMPVYRGDAVNDLAPDPVGRTADPERLLRAYHQSAATLNLVRAFATGGFADLRQVHAWNQDFVRRSSAGQRYEALAAAIEQALAFMRACGIDLDRFEAAHEVELYASHEALLLDYEAALIRQEEATGDWVDCSGHMLWIGDRTRQVDGAHVRLLSGVINPLGVKLGPAATPAEAVAVAGALDPDRTPGRLTFVARMGAGRVRDLLPPLVEAVADAGHPVVWCCDPMHGNTYESGRYKTRHFDTILDECRGFFEVHAALGTWPGCIHVELTGEDVTECLGGAESLGEAHLSARYESACDPRLNTSQSLELAFLVAEMLQARRTPV
ncbi:MAG TPA: 3-deoxy-7-phosphoheptulonate synthase class II [Mycobacteriales bacterium]|nr:3-deoxy-7-phosphoheptulonate synthase class II [Mycobacteriales bacterium]